VAATSTAIIFNYLQLFNKNANVTAQQILQYIYLHLERHVVAYVRASKYSSAVQYF